MAYDHLSEYFRAKNTIVQAANTSLAQWKTPYNFSIDDIVDEFFGTLYDWNNTSSVVLILLYVPTFLIALLGNILVILTVTGKKTLRQVRNYFLVNLAIADLTITLLCMPTSVGSIVYRLWIYGEFLCKATTFLQGKLKYRFSLYWLPIRSHLWRSASDLLCPVSSYIAQW